MGRFVGQSGRWPALWSWSPVRGVGVEAEQLVEALLGGGGFGEHAAGSGASSFALVEEHGFLDAGEGVEELADAEVTPARSASRTMRRATVRARTQ